MNGSCTQSGMKPVRNAQGTRGPGFLPSSQFPEGTWKNLAYYGTPILFGRLARPPILGRGVRTSARGQADEAVDSRFLVNNHGTRLASFLIHLYLRQLISSRAFVCCSLQLLAALAGYPPSVPLAVDCVIPGQPCPPGPRAYLGRG